jgi:hypothetical protein
MHTKIVFYFYEVIFYNLYKNTKTIDSTPFPINFQKIQMLK